MLSGEQANRSSRDVALVLSRSLSYDTCYIVSSSSTYFLIVLLHFQLLIRCSIIVADRNHIDQKYLAIEANGHCVF